MRGDLEWGSIPGLVRAAATRFADGEAVVEGRTRISYAELGARVERAAAASIASGVRLGDRVAIWAPNTLDWIAAALGAVSAGAVLVPLNTRFKGDGGGVRTVPEPGQAAVRDRHLGIRGCGLAQTCHCCDEGGPGGGREEEYGAVRGLGVADGGDSGVAGGYLDAVAAGAVAVAALAPLRRRSSQSQCLPFR